jgi:hypothetical protein
LQETNTKPKRTRIVPISIINPHASPTAAGLLAAAYEPASQEIPKVVTTATRHKYQPSVTSTTINKSDGVASSHFHRQVFVHNYKSHSLKIASLNSARRSGRAGAEP